MSTHRVVRPPRRFPPDPGLGAIEVMAPPRQSESMPITGSVGMILVPAASGVGAVLLAVTQRNRPLLAAAGLLVLAASVVVGVVMVVGSRTGDRRRTRVQRERYLDYLERVRQEAREAGSRQLRTAKLCHPPPEVAAGAAQSIARRWERRPDDADFLALRIGLGEVLPARPLALGFPPEDPLVSYDEVCLSAACALVQHYTRLADQPICLQLGSASAVSIRGGPDQLRSTARALIAQLVWAHSPDDVGVVVISDDPAAHWDWLKWLPHSLSRIVTDGPIGARLIATTVTRATLLLQSEADFGSIALGRPTRRLVVLVDVQQTESASPRDLATLRTTAKAVDAVVIHLLDRQQVEPDLIDIRVLAGDGGTDSIEQLTRGELGRAPCSLDQFDLADAMLLARSFAPLRPDDEPDTPAGVSNPRMDSLRSIDVATLDPMLTWRRRAGPDLLRVPIGVGADGAPVTVDLKESASGGMGPHGLVVGATGSGKSELLRTLVTTLAIGHPPAALALLLADFKGGATFSGLATLPHVAGMVTNLEADLGLVDRFRDALSGELQRRQELLAAAGKVSSLDAYQQLLPARPDLPPLPRLLVIVDEFSELLGARPDLAELFVTIGRIGRSIGIHLLLATQRLDTGRIRGLESHLSYRICLRTFSEAESREAMGSTAAYRLPAEPGWAYLRADTAEPVRFRASIVSRPHRPTRPPRTSTPAIVLPYLVENGFAQRIADLHRQSPIDTEAAGRTSWMQSGATVLEVVVDRVTTRARTHPAGRPVRPVWLEPLPTRLRLGELLPARCSPLAAVQPPETRPPETRPPGAQPQSDRLTVLLGLVDIPERQRQDLLRWDFDEGNGNLLIVGAGRSGKSTAVSTLLCSLADAYAPGEIALICVDFGGESLLACRGLPQVAAVATRSDPELTRLVFARLRSILDEREALFRRHRYESVTALRRARAAGAVDAATEALHVAGNVVVIIDGWAGLRDADPSVEAVLDDVLGRGPGLGVHTVLTITAAGQLRTRLAAGFGGRIELRLGDSFDSAIDRQLAKALPADRPGRCLVAGPHYAQLALPVSAGDGGQQEMVEQIGKRWPGPGVARISTLPAVIRLSDIRDRPGPAGGTDQRQQVVLGVHEDDRSAVRHSLLGADPHLLVYGETGSGKTSLLRNILSQLTSPGDGGHEGRAVEDLDPGELLVVDYRRGLPAGFGGSRRLCRSSEVVVACAALTTLLTGRLAGTSAHPAPNSEIYLLVDDYELVSSAAGNPLAVLLPFLPHARDIGFHLIVARRSGGAARAQYEPLLQSLGDLGTPVLLLSGTPAEGRLGHGLVPQPLPAGRAQFAMRGAGRRIIQIGWTPVN